MISYQQAYSKVLNHTQDYGTEVINLDQAIYRVLAEDIFADRDLPPYDRATRDGIVILHKTFAEGQKNYSIEGVIAAGNPKTSLTDTSACMEIMTGAIIPENSDTVVMYEHITIKNKSVKLHKEPIKGQHIHYQGTDTQSGSCVIPKHTRISAAEIAVLSAVGKSKVSVKRNPKVLVISTGDELVEVFQKPETHQIRKSNSHALYASLKEEGIISEMVHLPDDAEHIEKIVAQAIQDKDVLLLSGGVSKGKFDYIPQVLEKLAVQQVFHKVKQSPGKPFWFGIQEEHSAVIFSFPGNPVSTFATYHIYFKDWLRKSLGLKTFKIDVILEGENKNNSDLTQFLRARTSRKNGKLVANVIQGNGSGDIISLVRSDGFVCLEPQEAPYESGAIVPFIPTRRIY